MRNLIVVLTVLFASVMFLAKPAAAATRLSGISVLSACQHQYSWPSGSFVWWGSNVFSWRCIVPGKTYTVNLSQECKRIYGSTAYAAYTNYSNPYSWGCYR